MFEAWEVEGVLQFEARGNRLVCRSCCNASACYVSGGEHGKLCDDREHSDVTAWKRRLLIETPASMWRRWCDRAAFSSCSFVVFCKCKIMDESWEDFPHCWPNLGPTSLIPVGFFFNFFATVAESKTNIFRIQPRRCWSWSCRSSNVRLCVSSFHFTDEFTVSLSAVLWSLCYIKQREQTICNVLICLLEVLQQSAKCWTCFEAAGRGVRNIPENMRERFLFCLIQKMHLNAAGVAYTLYLWTPDDLPQLALPLIQFAYKTRQEIPSHINPSMSARVVRLYLKVKRSKTIRFGHRPECRAPSSGLRSLRSTHVNI